MRGLFGRYGLSLVRKVIMMSAKLLLFLCYRVRYEGFETLPTRSPYVMVANHVSFLDGLVLQCGVRRPLRFVIDYEIYHRPFVHVFMKLHRAIPVLPRSRTVERAMDEVSAALRRNEVVMIFPEGRLTGSGHLGRFKPGAERIVERDPVPVYPVAIKGLWGSVFSRKYRRSRFPILPRFWRPEVRVICGKPLQPPEATVQGMQCAVLELLRERERSENPCHGSADSAAAGVVAKGLGPPALDSTRAGSVLPPAGGAPPFSLRRPVSKLRDFAASLQQIINKRAEKG